jgi:hypothetical protein
VNGKSHVLAFVVASKAVEHTLLADYVVSFRRVGRNRLNVFEGATVSVPATDAEEAALCQTVSLLSQFA